MGRDADHFPLWTPRCRQAHRRRAPDQRDWLQSAAQSCSGRSGDIAVSIRDSCVRRVARNPVAHLRRCCAEGEDRRRHHDFAPEATVTDNFIPSLQKRVIAGMGSLHFIELKCSNEELEKRIQSEPRERFGKLRDVYKFRKLDEAGTFQKPKMPTPELVVDTTTQSPLESARVIARHLRQPEPR